MSGSGDTRPARNYRRRAVGACVCLAPIGLLVASLIVAMAAPRDAPAGVGVVACALPVALLNLYLSVARPVLHRWRQGSMDGFRNVSGIPLLGTFLVLMGGVIGFADWRAAAAGLVVLALDTGGLPWFLLATWRDRSVWDG